MEILIFLGVVAVVVGGVIAITRKADSTRPSVGVGGGKPRDPVRADKV